MSRWSRAPTWVGPSVKASLPDWQKGQAFWSWSGVGVEEDEESPSSATRYVAPSSACPATLLAKVTYDPTTSTSRRHAENRRGLRVILGAKPRTLSAICNRVARVSPPAG